MTPGSVRRPRLPPRASALRKTCPRRRGRVARGTRGMAAFGPSWAGAITSRTPCQPRRAGLRRHAIQTDSALQRPRSAPRHLAPAVAADARRHDAGHSGNGPDPAQLHEGRVDRRGGPPASAPTPRSGGRAWRRRARRSLPATGDLGFGDDLHAERLDRNVRRSPLAAVDAGLPAGGGRLPPTLPGSVALAASRSAIRRDSGRPGTKLPLSGLGRGSAIAPAPRLRRQVAAAVARPEMFAARPAAGRAGAGAAPCLREVPCRDPGPLHRKVRVGRPAHGAAEGGAVRCLPLPRARRGVGRASPASGRRIRPRRSRSSPAAARARGASGAASAPSCRPTARRR